MFMPKHVLSAGSPTWPRLSKSKIAAFEHCARRLWLQVHRPDLRHFDADTLALFECGHQIGALARWRYGRGALVTEDHTDITGALNRTRDLLETRAVEVIFEGAFERDGVIVRADILEADGWGGWKLIEVKNSGRVGRHHVHDLATQAWVIRAARICVSEMILRHVIRPLRPAKLARKPIEFVDADLTVPVVRAVEGREHVVASARTMASGVEPQVRPGPQCDRPSCEFKHHCTAAMPQPLGPKAECA